MTAPLIIGWDVGGAHIKACLLEHDRITDLAQWPTPLWQGLAQLDAALELAFARWPQLAEARHAVTMTAEMADFFPDRQTGVRTLAHHLAARLGPATRFYAGPAGWPQATDAPQHWQAIASANWLATASLCARRHPDAILVDIGSTTTDLIPLRHGQPTPIGHDDAARLAAGELVYLGAARTPLCALARRIRCGDRSYNVMNEFFATSADVFRLTGELDPAHDHYPAADNAPKTADATRRRLARMIGRDAHDAPPATWLTFAHRWRSLIRHEITRNLNCVTAHTRLPPHAPLIGAGAGLFLAQDIATQTARPFIHFADIAGVPDTLESWANVCAPAVAVAQLLRRSESG